MANVVYNKLYQRSLNILQMPIKSIEPRDKVWFAIANGTIFALPLFGDFAGPFHVEFAGSNLSPCRIQFDFAPSSSLFSPSNHLLLALFNMSSTNYKHAPSHRYSIVRTLSLALNLTESLLTIHRINGSMIKVYFSCDFFSSSNVTQQIEALIDHYYSRRLQLLGEFPLPLIEISIVRLAKSSLGRTTVTTRIELRKATITIKPRLLNNRTVIPVPNQTNPLILLKQLYQPLVLIPLAIILIGLIICSIIACCLCCNRRSSSSSTLLLPSGPTGSPNNRHLYQNYTYRKHRQQQEIYKKKHHYHKDQRQYISKGERESADETVSNERVLCHA